MKTSLTSYLDRLFYFSLACAVVSLTFAFYNSMKADWNLAIVGLAIGPTSVPLLYGRSAWRKWRRDNGKRSGVAIDE